MSAEPEIKITPRPGYKLYDVIVNVPMLIGGGQILPTANLKIEVLEAHSADELSNIGDDKGTLKCTVVYVDKLRRVVRSEAFIPNRNIGYILGEPEGSIVPAIAFPGQGG